MAETNPDTQAPDAMQEISDFLQWDWDQMTEGQTVVLAINGQAVYVTTLSSDIIEVGTIDALTRQHLVSTITTREHVRKVTSAAVNAILNTSDIHTMSEPPRPMLE